VVECWDSTERRSTQPSAMLLLHTNERGNSVQTQSALYLRVRHFEPVCKRNYCLDKPPLVLDPTPRFERWRRSLKLCDAIPVSVCASDWDFADGGKPSVPKRNFVEGNHNFVFQRELLESRAIILKMK